MCQHFNFTDLSKIPLLTVLRNKGEEKKKTDKGPIGRPIAIRIQKN